MIYMIGLFGTCGPNISGETLGRTTCHPYSGLVTPGDTSASSRRLRDSMNLDLSDFPTEVEEPYRLSHRSGTPVRSYLRSLDTSLDPSEAHFSGCQV